MNEGQPVQYYTSHGWKSGTLLEIHDDGKPEPWAIVNHIVTGKHRVLIADLKAITQEEGR